MSHSDITQRRAARDPIRDPARDPARDPERQTGAADASGPGTDVARWLALFHDREFSAVALRNRIPSDANLNDPATLARALGAVGLQARLVLRKLKQIDLAVLPCVVFRKDGTPLILLGQGATRRTQRVIDPTARGVEAEVPTRKLARSLGRDVLLVTSDDARATLRLREAAATPTRGHWFWAPMRKNAGGWLQIAIAALAINVLGLALPLFVMNVYDRVIPNLAFVTLWTLAIGVGIAIFLDLALRALRGQALERIGRRLDTGIASSLFAHAMSLRPQSHGKGA